MLLSGEPGIGKTVILDAAADAAAAADMRVLRAAGAEFEADVSFSGLNQALLPLVGELAHVNTVSRDALSVALGFDEGPAPDRLVVSTATLMLLRAVAEVRPVLLIVDDLPWLDETSAAVLGFVARRLAGSHVGFLATSRPGSRELPRSRGSDRARGAAARRRGRGRAALDELSGPRPSGPPTCPGRSTRESTRPSRAAVGARRHPTGCGAGAAHRACR